MSYTKCLLPNVWLKVASARCLRAKPLAAGPAIIRLLVVPGDMSFKTSQSALYGASADRAEHKPS